MLFAPLGPEAGPALVERRDQRIPCLEHRQQKLPFALRRVGVRRRAGQRPQTFEHHQRREHPLVTKHQHRTCPSGFISKSQSGGGNRTSRSSIGNRHSRASTRAMRANGEPGI